MPNLRIREVAAYCKYSVYDDITKLLGDCGASTLAQDHSVSSIWSLKLAKENCNRVHAETSLNQPFCRMCTTEA